MKGSSKRRRPRKPGPNPLPVEEAHALRERYGFTHLLVYGITPDNHQVVATHGRSAQEAYEIAQFGNQIKHRAGFPPEMCQDVPDRKRHVFSWPDREVLGRIVRQVWVEWAREQPTPKPSWLTPWEGLSEPDKEVDRRIGETLVKVGAVATLRQRAVDLEQQARQMGKTDSTFDVAGAREIARTLRSAANHLETTDVLKYLNS